MVRYRAAWVVPIAGRPVRDGWIEIENGRVQALGADGSDRTGAKVLGDVVVLPGLVNAHTHLELCYLHEAVPPSTQFVSWIRRVVEERRRRPDALSPEILQPLGAGIDQAVACGTALVGDISNTLASFDPLAGSALSAVVLYELIRFAAPDPDAIVRDARRRLDALRPASTVTSGLAAHAPYSVGPALLRALAQHSARRRTPFSVHVAESAAEVEFVGTGGGPWRDFLQDVGAWDPGWSAPAMGPVEYLERCGALGPSTLAVHGVHMTPADLRRVARSGSTIVTCPRSNARTGAGTPPIGAFYASGARVAVGTDSLASTPDLNLFAELAAMRTLAPDVAASALLASATWHGAAALGFDADFGTIEPGKRARLVAVTVPAGVADVEEYLVSGVRPDQIRWLQEDER